jgi:hypothetical protein
LKAPNFVFSAYREFLGETKTAFSKTPSRVSKLAKVCQQRRLPPSNCFAASRGKQSKTVPLYGHDETGGFRDILSIAKKRVARTTNPIQKADLHV